MSLDVLSAPMQPLFLFEDVNAILGEMQRWVFHLMLPFPITHSLLLWRVIALCPSFLSQPAEQ